MNVCIISSSPRANSNSLLFSKHLSKILQKNSVSAISIIDFHESDIPFFGHGKGIDKANLTDFQASLINSWQAADLVFMVSPEYNWSFSPELANALNILGGKDFAHLFDNKTFAMIGVSAGRGGRQPCLDLGVMVNKLISFLGQYSIVSPKIFEVHEINKNINSEADSLENPIFDNALQDFVGYSLNVAKRWA